MTDAATLTLVATPIGNLGDLSTRAVEVLRQVDVIACEDTRRTGRLCAHFEIPHAPFIVCNDHTEAAAAAEIVRRLDGGASVALVSDAGTPGLSDPGERVVVAALDAGHRVSAIPGPSAAVMALTISGLPVDRFVFDGFLPRKGGARSAAIAALAEQKRTSVIYESPKRVGKTLTDLELACGPNRRVAVARELTKAFEEIWRGTLAEAAAKYADAAPKGEFVIVIEGASTVAASDEQISEALQDHLDGGASRRDAIDAVVETLDATKRRVYDLALRL